MVEKVLADNPIEKKEEDLLLFQEQVELLSEIILTCETPYSIGINGKWGTGKTSLMKLLKNNLSQQENIECIWFDAWPFAHEDEIWKSMLVAILNEIDPEGELSVDKKELVKSIIDLSSSMVSSMLTGGLSTIFKKPKPEKIIDSFKERKEIILTNRVETIKNLRDEFEELVLKKVSRKGKLVIFIDDIDRVPPEKVVDILEAISLFLRTENTVILLACDLDYINNCITSAYQEQSITGYDFIEKILQLQFSVPKISDEIIENFIKKIFNNFEESENLETYKKLIDYSIGRNPRNIKRLANLFKVIMESRNESESYNDCIFLKLLCMELEWPELYQDCVQSYQINSKDNYFIKLENWARDIEVPTMEEFMGDPIPNPPPKKNYFLHLPCQMKLIKKRSKR